MLPVIAERSLRELKTLRGILSGDLDPSSLPGADQSKGDGGNRRAVALKIVDKLGSMFAHILQVSGLSEQEIFQAIDGEQLVREAQGMLQGEQPEKQQQFGFAHWRKEE